MLSSALNINPTTPSPSSESLQPGASFLLQIEKLVAGGLGLARWNGQVVFCADAIPGETVLVEIVARRRGVHYGKILEIRESAPTRIVPVCPLVERCGGCQLQHLRYEEQLRQKHLILEDTLSRVGKISGLSIAPVIPSPQPYGYRQVLRMGIGEGKDGWFLGFFESGTQNLFPVETCFLVSEDFRHTIGQLATRLQLMVVQPQLLVNVEIRWSALEKKYVVIFHGNSTDEKEVARLFESTADLPDVQGWVYDPVDPSAPSRVRGFPGGPFVRGVDHLWETFGGLRLKIGVRSFMQANWPLFEVMGQTVQAWIGDLAGTRILELYAGAGALGMSLAHAGARVMGVEVNPYAVQDARESIQVNRIKGCRMRAVSVESYLSTVQSGEYDVILLDPPRTGLRPKVLERLGALKVPRVLYLSCDPPSLSRDVKALCAQGYTIQRLQPFDMFPQTAHLETLVELAIPRS
jgi:23S rRNA (uracil1939-C5)-methyltransferase